MTPCSFTILGESAPLTKKSVMGAVEAIRMAMDRSFCPLKDRLPESKNTDPIGVGGAILASTSDNVAH
jgi:hypothetical protein